MSRVNPSTLFTPTPALSERFTSRFHRQLILLRNQNFQNQILEQRTSRRRNYIRRHMQLSGWMKLISGFTFLDDQKSSKVETTKVIIAIYVRKAGRKNLRCFHFHVVISCVRDFLRFINKLKKRREFLFKNSDNLHIFKAVDEVRWCNKRKTS